MMWAYIAASRIVNEWRKSAILIQSHVRRYMVTRYCRIGGRMAMPDRLLLGLAVLGALRRLRADELARKTKIEMGLRVEQDE
jgi:hypothetical protein